MAVTFAKSPLVEIVVELRWLSGAVLPVQAAGHAQAAPPVPVFLGNAKAEEFFMGLGGEFYKAGFQRSERLIPPGFPTVLGQPVVRYRSDDAERKAILYQAGPGLFTVNGIPPYQSWDTFSPAVTAGIEALLKLRSPEETKQPFNQIMLRYINLFQEEFMEGKNLEAFLTESLGVSIRFPDAISRLAKVEEATSIFVKTILPTEIGALSVLIGDGKAGNDSGVIFDITLTSTQETLPETGAVMKILDSAHSMIHDMFLGATEPLNKLMQPQEARGH